MSTNLFVSLLCRPNLFVEHLPLRMLAGYEKSAAGVPSFKACSVCLRRREEHARNVRLSQF